MKVKTTTAPAAPRTPKPPAASAATSEASKTWGPSSGTPLRAARQRLTGLATNAAMTVITEHKGPPEAAKKHPLLQQFGRKLGLGLGVIVTQALALVPSWNKKLVDANGKPVKSIEGATRVGDHDLRQRHLQVVGPKITALVEKLPPSAVREVLVGLGKGATEAPGATYRLEAAVADMVHKR